MYFIKFSTSSCMKLDFVIIDADVDTLYGLINITFSSSTSPFLDSNLHSSSLCESCISQILSFMYLFSHPLYLSNSSANIL